MDPEVTVGEGMTLMEHLAELRTRLVKSALALAAGAVVGFAVYPVVLDILLQPYCEILPPDRECNLIITDPLEGFRVRLQVAGYTGLVLALPVILYQLWRFVTPGLHANERRMAVPFVASSLMLFVAGAALALWSFPRALDFLASIGGEDVETLFAPGNYLRLVTYLMLAFGVGFEFPILLVFLQLIGVLSPSQLAGFRRWTIILIVSAVAIMTPSGDPFTLAALSVPMYVFYEVSILIGRLVSRRRRPAEASDG